MEISDGLAEALRLLVQLTDAAEAGSVDRQAARQAIEQASVVVHLARV